MRLTRLSCYRTGLVLVLLGIGTASASAINIRHDVSVTGYNALAQQVHFASAGYLYDGGQFCTAVLVAPNKVLTAAHCVDFNANGIPDGPVTSWHFGQSVNISGPQPANVASVVINPSWSASGGDATFDMALLTLTTNLSGPYAKFTSASPLNKLGTMVGYGTQGTGLSASGGIAGANDRLAAQNIIDSLASEEVRTDFDHPSGTTNTYGSAFPLLLEGTTNFGDSGGPIYAQFGDNGHWRLVGILNGGFNNFGPFSTYGDVSIWAGFQHANNIAWLNSQGIFASANVPEPQAFLMLCVALGLICVLNWRARSRRFQYVAQRASGR